MRRARRGVDATPNIWPGFTDALAGLVVVLVFLLVLFFLFEVVLSRQVTGQEQVIGTLRSQVDRLAGLLGESQEKRRQLASRLEESRQRGETLSRQLAETREELAAAKERREALEEDLAAMRKERKATKEELAAARKEQEATERELAATRERVQGARANMEVLSERVAALNARLARLERALAIEEQAKQAAEQRVSELKERVASQEERVSRQQGRIQAMAAQIRTQLLERVEELEKYRSEFFGRLREVFTDEPNIKIRGDRFVFQSEILFPSGKADLSAAGKDQLKRFVEVYEQAKGEIPEGLDMTILVEGYTDRVPIKTAQFSSNWELSAARALSVVHFLIDQGIAPKRLAAAGYGEYHPLTPGSTPQQRRQNRRIEIKITQR
ncbi:OmpA family protein [Thiohalorhabdus methylotrophus]|uniref:OmpA family protein n=1 Tax=Thiohalorhabdus methylotrophus TaxID=3242694 RepID=A0ABV4TPL2_9GAMM